jgi:hypothetical protein
VNRAAYWLLAAALTAAGASGVLAQKAEPEPDSESLIDRPDPPKLDDFESDENRDGVPDGWYNLRDAKIVKEGGAVGPKYLKFECVKMGRPARLSRAFGVDGRKTEAILLGLWVRIDQIRSGERQGEDPGLIIDFLGAKLRHQTRGTMGPWTNRSLGAASGWTRVVRRISVPPGARDAIMSVGLLGATGVLDIDGLTVELVPIGGKETTNLVGNPGFELGDPDPTGWVADNGARRGFPGYRSSASLELARDGARCTSALALPVETFGSLSIAVRAKGQGLRGSGGANAWVFFINEDGRQFGDGFRALRWSGSFDWREDTATVTVARGASYAVLQFDKPDGIGKLHIDDVTVTASPDADAGRWTPYHIADDTDTWSAFEPSLGVVAKSALDFSFLLHGPAGRSGRVVVRKGRFHFDRADRARFFGVQLLAPSAFLEAEKADTLADRLARSGVNLVRLSDLDAPLGPDRSLFDDTRDDTKHLDEGGLARLDHLVAALKARGIYVALELQSARRFRPEDGVDAPGALPPGGGPAAVIDPILTKLETEAATALLNHVNPETKVAWKDEPALAWVTLAGEVSLFNLIDDPSALLGDYAKELKTLAAKSTSGTGRRFWQGLESSHYTALADSARQVGLKAPLAGVSHWRRELEFCEAQAAPGLDLIDDRIYWVAPPLLAPRFRSALWSLDGGLIVEAARKRRPDRPYVLGQWCDFSGGIWALPYEASEQLLAAASAVSEDWDGLVRRGLFLWPDEWGKAATGTSGGEDIFQIPEVANASPQVFALWPHAASLMLRGHTASKVTTASKPRAEVVRRPGGRGGVRRHQVPGWEPERGRLLIDSAYTQGVAGWPGAETASLPSLTVDVENPYAVVVASSANTEPIARSNRLLVTAIARVYPTGFSWVDPWRKETADPGRPPLLVEPIKGTVTWLRKGSVKAYALDNDGKRLGPAKTKASDDGTTLVLDGATASVHFEMVVE